MIHILLEASFPEFSSSRLSTEQVRFARYQGSSVTDAQMLNEAAEDGYSAVVFLGRQTLGRSNVVRLAAELGLSLIATETFNPIDAVEYLRQNEAGVRRHLSANHPLLVLANEVREGQ